MKKSTVFKSIIKGVIVPILTMSMILPSGVPVFAAPSDSDFYELGEIEVLGEKNVPPGKNQPSQANPHSSNWNMDGANLLYPLYPYINNGRAETASAAVTSSGKVSEGFLRNSPLNYSRAVTEGAALYGTCKLRQ